MLEVVCNPSLLRIHRMPMTDESLVLHVRVALSAYS
jgi:hypothetical protein